MARAIVRGDNILIVLHEGENDHVARRNWPEWAACLPYVDHKFSVGRTGKVSFMKDLQTRQGDAYDRVYTREQLPRVDGLVTFGRHEIHDEWRRRTSGIRLKF